MIAIVWLLNFAISWFNAWACGRVWNETKYIGGFPHFMNWMGAVMSASGFTWCYLVIAVYFGQWYPVEQDDGTTAALLTQAQVQATADLGYLLVLGPILGSGIMITMQAWVAAWKRRTAANMGIAAWDTFAMIYNVSSAFTHVPKATGRLGDFFGGDDKGKGAVVLIVIAVALAGILTTYTILTKTAEAAMRKAKWEYELAKT